VIEPEAPARTGVAARTTATFVVLVLLGGLTKAVGILREIVLAADFGASRQMDALLVAQTLPAAVQRVFDELLGATVLPLFTGWLLASGESVAWARMYRLLRWLLLACGALVAAALPGSRALIVVLAPGLNQAGTGAAVRALEIMLPSIALVVAGTVCTALLNYYHRFVQVALIALAGNLLALLCIVFYAGRLGIYSAALGMTLGAATVVLLQWWALPAAPRGRPDAAPARLWLAEFSRLARPLGAGIALFNLIPLVERFLSSWLPEGNIALLNYAFKVDWLAYMIFVLPLTAMVFPRLATAGAVGDRERFQRVFVLALKTALLVLLPIMVILVVSGEAIVRLLYQRGSFGAADTAATVPILRIYVLGLPGAAATVILFYALYALRLPAGRVRAGVVGLAIAMGCGGVCVRWWGARGIALTHAINFSFIAVVLGVYLARTLGSGWLRAFGGFAARVILAAAATLPLVWLVKVMLERAAPEASVAVQTTGLVASSVAAASGFVASCWLLRVTEVRSLANELREYVATLANWNRE